MENFNKFNLSCDFVGNNDSVKELNFLLNKLDKCFQKDSDNFAETCYLVFRIKQLFKNYYFYNKKNDLYSFDSIMQGFGISSSESSRLLSCYDKFVTKETEKPLILAEFYGFSKSKLFELLQVDSQQIVLDLKNKVLRFDFSVKQIREYVKNYQAQLRANKRLMEEDKADLLEEIDESQIPMAYEPEKEYEFSYFETKTKSQLLNMIWDLQKAYQKLKKEKMKNGK